MRGASLRVHQNGGGRGWSLGGGTPSDDVGPTRIPDAKLLRTVETLVAYVLLALAAGAFMPLIRPAAVFSGSDADPVTQGLWAMLSAGALFLLLRRRRRGQPAFRPNWAVGAYWLMATMSVAWAIDRGLAERRVESLLATIVAACFLITAFPGPKLLSLLNRFVLACAVGTILLAGIRPSQAYDTAGNLQGVFFDKNALGLAMALGAITAALLFVTAASGGVRWWSMGAFLIDVLVLMGTRSGTSAVALAASLSVILLISVAGRGNARLLVLGLVSISGAVGVLVLLAIGLTPFLRLLGKSDTLTGRTVLWRLVINAVETRPVLGWGYGSFWSAANPSAQVTVRGSDWAGTTPIASAHNGYLENLLGLGVFGLILAVLVLALMLLAGVRYLTASDIPGATAMLGLLTFIVVYNMSESRLLVSRELLSLVLVAMIAVPWRRRAGKPTSVAGGLQMGELSNAPLGDREGRLTAS